MAGVILEQWHWWTLTLIACTFAFFFSNSKPAWVAIASTVVGAILWFNPKFSLLYQFGVFFVITALGSVLTTLIMNSRKKEGEAVESDEPQRVLRTDRLIGQVMTLESPIVNGNGELVIQGVTLRIRGVDCEAGKQIRVVGVDGIDRTLIMVEPVDGIEEDY